MIPMVNMERLVEIVQAKTCEGRIAFPTHTAERVSRPCGDKLRIDVKMVGSRIFAISWTGSGCYLTKGIAGLMCHLLMGSTIENAMKFPSPDKLVDFEIALGRKSCAALPFETFLEAIHGQTGNPG